MLRMKKIAFLHEIFPLGGAEKVTLDLIGYLAAQGYEIYLFVREVNEELLSERDRKAIRFLRLPHDVTQSAHNAVYMADRLQHLSIDVFVLPMTMLKYLRRIRQAVTCKIVFHHHSVPLWEVQNRMTIKRMKVRRKNSLPAWLGWWLVTLPKEKLFRVYTRRYTKQYKVVCALTDRFVVLCDDYRRQIAEMVGGGNLGAKIRVMTNPYTGRTDYGSDKRKEVLFVGRMTYADKRADRLLDIWARIEPRFPDWTLKLVGDGPERERLEAQARRLGLKRVLFCGYSPHPAEHYQTAAILCMTSSFEGWGLVLVEAQAAGVVPMAFGCSGGVRQILGDDGKTGICVEPFDLAAYERELSALMSDQARRRAMQQAMREKVADYSLERIGHDWMELFAELGCAPEKI